MASIFFRPDYLSIRLQFKSFNTYLKARQYIADLKEKQTNAEETIIANEYLQSGSRYFLVITYEEFVTFYLHLKPINRCFYEIIFPDALCYLYFDIEYDKSINTNINSIIAFNNFMHQLIKELFNRFSINCSLFGVRFIKNVSSNGEFVIMDASNFNKYSRHIVLYLYDMVIFRHQGEVFRFVSGFNNKITDMYTSNVNTVSNIIIRHQQGNIIIKKPFIDMTVYKKNQQFRIVGSSKFKEQGRRPLKILTSPTTCITVISTLDYSLFVKMLVSFRAVEDTYFENFIFNINKPDNIIAL